VSLTRKIMTSSHRFSDQKKDEEISKDGGRFKDARKGGKNYLGIVIQHKKKPRSRLVKKAAESCRSAGGDVSQCESERGAL